MNYRIIFLIVYKQLKCSIVYCIPSNTVEYVTAVNLDWEVGLMRIWSIQVLVLRTDRVMIGSVLGRECQVLKDVWVRAPWEPPLCVEVGVLLRSPTSSVVSVGLWSVCLLVKC